MSIRRGGKVVGKARARGVVASGGTSALSMVACCAHHLADVLPIVGLASVAVVLSTYQPLFLLLGILSNVVGLVYVLGLVRRHGIYPDRPSLLSWSVRWPVDRALPYTLGGPALVFAVAVVLVIT